MSSNKVGRRNSNLGIRTKIRYNAREIQVLASLIEAEAGPGGPPSLPPGPGRELAERACLACHDATIIAQQRLDRGRWVREMDKMIRWGAPVSPQEKEILVEYFYSHLR